MHISSSKRLTLAAVLLFAAPGFAHGQRYTDASGHLRVALVKQPFLPNGISPGPTTIAEGGIQAALTRAGATVRVAEVKLPSDEDTEYVGWKRLSTALGPFCGHRHGE